jgi:hypothetical protein
MDLMPAPSADEELAQIKALLDARVKVQGSEDMTIYQRVLDVIESYETWSDLAISRLHEIHRLTGRMCAGCANRPEPHVSLPRSRDDRIVVRLTAGGLSNNYVSLAEHLDFFPPAAVGQANVRDGAGSPLTLHFAGLDETVQTDITADHKSFRRRGPWGRFFAHHHLAEGDQIIIERLNAYEYRIKPVA